MERLYKTALKLIPRITQNINIYRGLYIYFSGTLPLGEYHVVLLVLFLRQETETGERSSYIVGDIKEEDNSVARISC